MLHMVHAPLIFLVSGSCMSRPKKGINEGTAVLSAFTLHGQKVLMSVAVQLVHLNLIRGV